MGIVFFARPEVFEDVVEEHVTPELIELAESLHATHLRYRVVRDG